MKKYKCTVVAQQTAWRGVSAVVEVEAASIAEAEQAALMAADAGLENWEADGTGGDWDTLGDDIKVRKIEVK